MKTLLLILHQAEITVFYLKTYNSVIELTYDFSVDDPVGGSVVSAGGGKYYYAKGVGLIESYFGFSFFGVSSTDTTRLLKYTIR